MQATTADRPSIQIVPSLKEAWAIFLKAPEVFVALAFCSFAVNMLVSRIPGVGSLLSLLFHSLLPGAFFLVAQEAARGEKASFEALRPLAVLAPQLLMMSVVRSILIVIGFLCLVVPGIYFVLMFAFADLFVVLEGKSFWEAMMASKALARRNWPGVLGLLVFLALLALSGLLFALIGVLATAPLAAITFYCVFRRIA